MKPTREDFLIAVVKGIEHHTDGMTRTEDDYKNFSMGRYECAFCMLFSPDGMDKATCPSCPLHQIVESVFAGIRCAKEYNKATSARCYNNYSAFIKAETALVKRLKGMLSPTFYDEFYSKEKETVINK